MSPTSPRSRPYKLITSNDEHATLGEGRMRHYATMINAANAFVHADEPYRQIVYDDGCEVRELNDHEHGLLERACAMLGYKVEEVEG